MSVVCNEILYGVGSVQKVYKLFVQRTNFQGFLQDSKGMTLPLEGNKKASKTAKIKVFKAFSMAGWTRLELATSGLTGRRSNQLNYQPAKTSFLPLSRLELRSGRATQLNLGVVGIEPTTPCL